MVVKYFDGTLRAGALDEPMDCELNTMAGELRGKYEKLMDTFQTQAALEEVFKVISRANKYIDETAPWVLAKDEANRDRLATVMYNLLEALRICTQLLTPFMPESTAKAADQLGVPAGAPHLGRRGQVGRPARGRHRQQGRHALPAHRHG